MLGSAVGCRIAAAMPWEGNFGTAVVREGSLPTWACQNIPLEQLKPSLCFLQGTMTPIFPLGVWLFPLLVCEAIRAAAVVGSGCVCGLCRLSCSPVCSWAAEGHLTASYTALQR